MKVDLTSDFPVSDEACEAATGKSITQWHSELDARPELRGKRREAINMWMYPEMGKNIWWAATAWVEWERRRGIVQKDGRIEGYNICVTKTLNASVSKVCQAWISPNVDEWFGDGAKLLSDHSIEDMNGNKAIMVREREDKDFRYRWQTAGSKHETLVDVVISDKGGGKTNLMLNHNRIQTREEADGLRRAWTEAFNKLKAFVEAE